MNNTEARVTITQSDILFEDNHLIAVNKKAGWIVQPDKTGDDSMEESVKLFLKNKYNKPGNVFVGVTHRIDRPVSGLVLFAKTSKALARLNALFQERKMEKTYLLITRGNPAETEGTPVHYLLRDTKNNKSAVSLNPSPGALRCELAYRTEAQSDSFRLLRVWPHTGRHHQIRVQMAALGCPITGDVKYGDRRANEDRSICLHAFSLRFRHPVSEEEIALFAPPPTQKFWRIFDETVRSLMKPIV